MRAATLRWAIFLSALLAVGPAASFFLLPLRAPDGALAATPLMTSDPIAGLGRGVVAMLIALAMGLLACRIAGFRSALSAVGIVLAWMAWRTGGVDQVLRSAGSASALKTLAFEGAIFGLMALALAVILAQVGRVVEQAEEGDIGQGSPLAKAGVGSAKSLAIYLPIAVIVGGAAAWIVAATPIKGQAIFGAVLGGVAVAAAGRLLTPRMPLAIMLLPIAVLATISPIVGMLLASAADAHIDSYRGTLAPIAHVLPLDWIAGGFLGIPLGAAWATSMLDKQLSQSAA